MEKKLGVSVAIIERKSRFGGPTGLTSKVNIYYLIVKLKYKL